MRKEFIDALFIGPIVIDPMRAGVLQ